jgi:hypothetical protein
VHWIVDSIVVFLLVVLIALFFGAELWTVIVASLLVGLPLAPLTRNLEERGLARRSD